MKHCHYFFLVLSFLILSCQSPWDKELLYGAWKTQEWKVVETNEPINIKMDFTFNDDGTYKIDYGSEIEEGKFWFFADFLHTVEKGQAEKKVKIIQLAKDTFIFEMNRGGSIEKVLLVK